MPGMPGVAPRASAGLDLQLTSATWAIWGSWASVASGPGGAVLAGKYLDQKNGGVFIGLMVGRNLSKIFGCHVYWRVLISHLYL